MAPAILMLALMRSLGATENPATDVEAPPPAETASPPEAAPAPEALSAEDRYAHEHLWVRSVAVAEGGPGAQARTYEEGTIYLGSDPTPLGPVEFYETVGRADLAAQVCQREATRSALMLGGGALLGVAGGLLAHLHAPQEDAGMTFSRGEAPALSTAAAVSGLAGLGLLLFGLALPVDLHGPDTKRALIEEHNAALRKRLGLSGATPSTPAASNLRLDVGVSTRGGALTLRGRF